MANRLGWVGPVGGAVAALLMLGLVVGEVAEARPPRGHVGPHGPRVRGPRFRVRLGPPAVRVEIRPAAPSVRHVWVPGYWAWRGRRHIWIGGGWALPPTAGLVWIEPRWAFEGGQWLFYEGYWASAPVPQPPPVTVPPPAPPPMPVPPPGPPPQTTVPPPPGGFADEDGDGYADQQPPQPQVETLPPAPFAGAVWIAGRWRWRGGWQWVPGHYQRAPQPGGAWVPGRWELRGGRWYWVRGHWVGPNSR